MIKKTSFLCSLLICSLLFSCANTPKSEKPKTAEPYAEFTTSLSAEGNEQFIYTETYPKQERRSKKKAKEKRGHKGNRDGARRSSGQRPDKSKKEERTSEQLQRQEERKQRFYTNLEKRLNIESFCTNGYKEIEFRTKQGDMQLIGHCLQ